MNIRTLTLILGSALTVAAAGVGASACSSSSSGNGGGSSSGSHADGGSSSGSSSGGSSSGGSSSGGSSSGGSSSGGSSSGGDASACKTDPSLHAETVTGTIFCGYDDAGATFSCTTGNECCLGGKAGSGFAPETCATWGSTCTNGTGPVPIECGQTADCTANGKAGGVCCIVGASAPAAVTGCDSADLKSSGGTAIQCEGSGDAGAASDGGASDAGAGTPGACASGEMQVCALPADCPTGKTCTPIRWKLYEIGVCL